ncbi:MAG: hypothetical protein JNJ61_14910 [Anaerolineae bacterium]|nr:hypothetical protein [Anaerolineae bacterium]
MSGEGAPLQYALFSGELVDTRTATQKQADLQREQPQQTEMFRQRDVAQFGVRARPQMSLSPHTKLVLIAEDPRTEEEIERDHLRQAQELTAALFPADRPPELPPALLDTALTTSPSVVETAQEESEVIEDNPPEALPPAPPLPSKYSAYVELVKAAEEQAGTLSATSAMLLSQRITLSAAMFDAKRAGLNDTEIATAVTIGEFRGRTPREAKAEPVTSTQPEPEIEDDAEIPILWASRADFLTRRPDLAEQIGGLREHEIEALAALVGQALEEFYWIQLNVILSLFLDHDLRLTRVAKRSRQAGVPPQTGLPASAG